jgi:integral membrane sensor domain MASE1
MGKPLANTQAIIAVTALAGITVLGVTGHVTDSVLSSVYSMVIGSALGGVSAATNGVKAKINGKAAANGQAKP